MMPMNPQRVLPPVLLVCAVGLSGCLKARQTDRILYDPHTDRFRLVMVLENISGNGGDLEYLAAIHANKDHLLAPFVPGNLMGYAPWYIRLADHKAAKLTFTHPLPGDMNPIDVKPPLAAIDIRPGVFFVQDNQLCYYHALAVPGEMIDALLGQTRRDQFKNLKKTIQTEIDRRRKGGRTHTWDELIAQEIKALRENSTNHPIKPHMVLEEESLQLMVHSVAGNRAPFVRRGKDLQFDIPLTPRDRDGAATLWTTWRNTADEAAEIAARDNHRKAEDSLLPLKRLPTQHITVSPTDQGIRLSLDLVSLYNSFADSFLTYMDSQSPPRTPKQPTFEVTFAQSRNWVASEPFTTEQILKAFEDDTLPSFPSSTPVPPGTNLKLQPK